MFNVNRHEQRCFNYKNIDAKKSTKQHLHTQVEFATDTIAASSIKANAQTDGISTLKQCLPEMTKLDIAYATYCIATRLKQLHSLNITYGDLSIHDCLVTKDGEIHLSTKLYSSLDKLNLTLKDSAIHSQSAGKVKTDHHSKLTTQKQEDLYALSDIVFEMSEKHSLFEKLASNAFNISTQTEEIKLTPNGFAKDLADLIKLCRHPSATAAQIKNAAEQNFLRLSDPSL